MAKVSRRYNAPPPKTPGIPILLFKGIMVSLLVSVICTLFLSLISLVTESLFLDNYMKYIMVAVSVVSIFIGSAYAAQKAGSGGLVIGIAVGIIYVLISVGIGLEMSNDSTTIFVLINKFLAGIAAGALGGLVGVNL